MRALAAIRTVSELGLVGFLVATALFVLYANAQKRADGSDNALHIVVPLLPPHMDKDGSGREAEIIRAAFRATRPELEIVFHVEAFSRHWHHYLSDERYAAVSTVPVGSLDADRASDSGAAGEVLDPNGYASSVYVRYQNGIGFVQASFPEGLQDAGYAALTGRSVVAFSGAHAILPGFDEVRREFHLYREEANQRRHSELLRDGAVDAVIADGAIFKAYNQDLGYAPASGVGFVPVGCATPYVVVFRSAALGRAFDEGLKLIEKRGILGDIERDFIQRLQLEPFGYAINRCD